MAITIAQIDEMIDAAWEAIHLGYTSITVSGRTTAFSNPNEIMDFIERLQEQKAQLTADANGTNVSPVVKYQDPQGTEWSN